MQRLGLASLANVTGGAGGVCTFNNNTRSPINVQPEQPGRFATPSGPATPIAPGGSGTIPAGNYSVGGNGSACNPGSTVNVGRDRSGYTLG